MDRTLHPEILSIEWSFALDVADTVISIVDINRIPIPLVWEVMSANKVLVVKDEMRQIREELRISSMYELDVLYHRRHYG